MARRSPILNALGIPRHGECKNCGDPIAENPERPSTQRRWQAFPVLRPSGQTGHKNADGSANLDGQKCNESKSDDGGHRPKDGSLW